MKKRTKKTSKKSKTLKRKASRPISVRKKTVSKKRKASVPKRAVRRTAVAKVQKPLLEPMGRVTHYFPHVQAGVVKVTKGILALGDTVHFKGHTTDFKQQVTSLQLNHQPIQKAGKGQEVGLQVKSRVRQHDLVFKLE